ncbi:MAG: lipopolysaccharide kinase InaA family protein [Methylophilaceae bacterium]|jgi:tRNA A-37 threonylcarbamoyl transferase component Bud32
MKKNNISLLADFGIHTTAVALDDSSVLTALEAVRYIPRRRCVCKATWQGKHVYAKLFFGEKAAQYALRDVRGVEALQHAKLLTPAILKQSKLSQHEGYVVVFEAITPSEDAEVVWAAANEFSRVELAHQLVQLVAQHHEAGLIQTDLHLKNFLIQHGAIHTIDGDGIRHFKKLPFKKAYANLCQLLSKFDVLTIDGYLSALLETYTNARSWQQSLNIDVIKVKINAARQKTTAAYADKKVFRPCTDVVVSKTKHVFVAINALHAVDDFPQTIPNLDAYFTLGNIIKNGNTCIVASAKIGSLNVVIKRYNIKGFWHGVGRVFRRTRASTSWGNAHRLQLLGLPTAKPIALIETRRFGLKGKAYFITEYVDALDMDVFFKQSIGKVLRAEAVKQAVQLFYRLYLLNISHGDMKATNIKVLADGKPLLIDLDSMQQHKKAAVAQKAHVRDIKRFMRNWKDTPSLYNAFVKVFKVVYADHAPLQAAQILE